MTRPQLAMLGNSLDSAASVPTQPDQPNVAGLPLEPAALEKVCERFNLLDHIPRITVDRVRIIRALQDYADVPGLEGHALDCAEWLHTTKGKKDAAMTLRNWLRRQGEIAIEADEKPNPSVTNRPTQFNHIAAEHDDILQRFPLELEPQVVRAIQKLRMAGRPVSYEIVEKVLAFKRLA